MSFTEANTVKAHLRDLLAGRASAPSSQLYRELACAGGKIAGLGYCAWFPKSIAAYSSFEGFF